ncbi:methionine--tRNA ligase [Leptospira sp. 85282-16]|uniref:Methionine--tRNA ligase n=1 Tax=Leptospira montravelensis TaxID=2484961 RepID=A0ABY2LRG7_9LEPT|nr:MULTISPECIES: methionine--tRNA ligase [Leptospira]MCT8334350.1 methionine--tRNA ligase [Leptospira sp. 85282-16]TGK80714.1 methionine--tRNA ligase [Leptospira montravelensis]TGL01696.1 methionine--tRNA ligase [Leptospira montravelensis]
MSKNILVTSALPYANGSIHLGHVLEAVQTDIWVRFQKLVGNNCYFFCADDTHGTPIMIAAKKAGKTPETMIEEVQKEHYKDLTSFGVSYDNYYTTNSEENKKFSESIYLTLKKKGHIVARNIEQSYCEHDKMFLPDRFIKGTCPKCGAKDQYGDSCEVCGTSYSPKDLKDSYCSICGTTPVLKESKHLFFKLQDFQSQLQTWIEGESRLNEGAQKKLKEWFTSGLQEWDISRDGPYFGFAIPEEENKYFYVWLDAPIGYMASSMNFLKDEKKFNEIWKEGKGEIVHFIGKDILYFHGLFWPAMLMGADYQTPSQLNVHGFLTVNGEKMSKSRGTFINASTFAKYLDVEHFRFYLACRLGSGMEDVDISFDDFVSRVNSDLIGNLVNLVSRVSTSILDKMDRKLGALSEEGKSLVSELLSKETEIREAYESRNYSKVMREITGLGDKVNKYVNDYAPWNLIKSDVEKAREVVTTSLNCAKILFTYLGPVTPNIVSSVAQLFQVENLSFLNLKSTLENQVLGPYQMLSKRVEEKNISLMIEETKEAFQKANPEKSNVEPGKTTSPTSVATTVSEDGFITIDELSKVELRVGQIMEAGPVEGADKLLFVKVNLGEKGIKNVFAGIKASYTAEELVGKKVVVVANLKPRQMKFGLSEAMLLASGKEKTLSLFVPDRDANPGDLLK